MKIQNTEITYIPIISEVVNFPIYSYNAINRLRKKERIKESLDKINEEARNNKEISKVLLREYEVLCEKDKNIFVQFFYETPELNLEERLEYCLSKFKKESDKVIHSCALNFKLENDFIYGAKACLTYYYIKNNIVFENHILEDSPETIQQPNSLNNKHGSVPIQIPVIEEDSLETSEPDKDLTLINHFEVVYFLRKSLNEISKEGITKEDLKNLINEKQLQNKLVLKRNQKCKLYHILREARKLVKGDKERQEAWSVNIINNFEGMDVNKFLNNNDPLREKNKQEKFKKRIEKEFNDLFQRHKANLL